MAKGPAYEVWKTVNDCLINNRCWLCKQVFQKGKIKKVFMVSDIVRCLLRRRDQIAARVEAYNSTVRNDQDADANVNSAISEGTQQQGQEEIFPPLPPPSSNDVSSSSSSIAETTSIDFDSWPDVDMKIENLRAAWEAYAFHGEDFNQMDDHLLSAQVSTWMSGLVCCTSDECASAYNIVMDKEGPDVEDDPILQQA